MLRAVPCAKCGKTFYRSTRQYNEAIKFNWKQYCSEKCQYEAKNKQIVFTCSRPNCEKIFKRTTRDFLRYGVAYCSLRCSALVNNKKYPRWMEKVKKCAYCGKEFRRNKKYCSPECWHKDQRLGKDLLLAEIEKFAKSKKRIPFKREFSHYSAVRSTFGTWNGFVKAAGFEPNPVMFANKFIAQDGHKCDSLSEKIIDDWLSARKIKHIVHYPYPGGGRFTVDFKVGEFWIEFFGLSGQLKKYDELRLKKINRAKIHNLKITEIYPDDIFPKSRLDEMLQKLSD